MISLTDLTIRPRRGRHTRPVLTLTAVVGLFLLCGAGKIVDRASLGNPLLRPAMFTLLVVLLVLPLALLVLVSALNVRNVALRVRDGRLVSTDWTGRVVTVDEPRHASVYPVGSAYGFLGELLVISGPTAVVLAPRWWAQEDLHGLFTALHLRPRQEQAVTFGQIAKRYPGARLPVSVRRPWLFGGGMVAASLGYLFLVTYLLLHF